jgi:hypothetical protein
MENKTLSRIENRIQVIKAQLHDIGPMRPGSLTQQYRNPKEGTGAFFQISYTYKMKSRTEYVRPQFVSQVREQIRNYKIFKNLVEEWVALGIQYCQLSMKAAIDRTDPEHGQTKKPKARK